MHLRTFLALVFLPGLLWSTSVAHAQDMSFRLVPAGNTGQCGEKCLQIIAAEGEIVDTTPQAFIDFIREHLGDKRVRSVVLFHSPGGKVAASIRLGFILRKIGAATVVARALADSPGGNEGLGAARCYSACVYALMGGKKRVVPPQSEVGIHRSFIARYGEEPKRENLEAVPKVDGDLTLNIIGRYSDTMGVSRGLIQEAQRTSPTNIHILTRNEISRWRLADSRL